MIKRTLFLLVFFSFSYLSLEAQIIKSFAAAGLNLSQVDGDEAYGYHKAGGNVGLGIMVPFLTNFDASLETSISQKGAYQKPQYILLSGSDTLTGEYNLRLNYAEIPILIQYTDKNFISAGIGASLGIMVGAKEYEHGKKMPTTVGDGTYANLDYSVLLDAKMRIKGRLWGNFRFQYSMKRIRSREFSSITGLNSWTRHQFNNTISFRLFYIFNEQQSERVLIEKKLEGH